VKFGWIDEHRGQWEVRRMCRVLEMSASGYYTWRQRQHDPGAAAVRRKELLEQIGVEQERGRGVYGSPRIQAGLAERGVRVCVNTVAKLMKQAGIRALRSRRFRPMTTDSRHAYTLAPNRLDRDFQAQRPDQKWLCDITYVPTD
jgi:putative transposase